jgi:hypothetical protein
MSGQGGRDGAGRPPGTGFEPEGGAAAVPEPGEAEAGMLLGRLEEAVEVLRARSNDDLVRVLGAVGNRLLDPRDPLRREAMQRLPDEAGLSVAMARRLLDRMARDWTPSALSRLLAAEFVDPAVLEGFRPGPYGDAVRAMGEDLALHICAGNVAGVGVTSLLRSLLVRSPVLLKPGEGDVVLPTLAARVIREEDDEVGRAVAVKYWRGGTRSFLERMGLQRAGRVVVYGGFDTVEEIRSRLPVTTPLVVYHHRVSVAAVARERLGDEAVARELARNAAEAVSAYDQRGCVSPHVIWVEEGASVTPAAWAELLAGEMAAEAESRPIGPVEAALAGRIHQLRGEAELREAGGEGHRVLASKGVDWTVLYEPESHFLPGCTGRLVRVQPLPDLADLPRILHGRGHVLQSIGLEAGRSRRADVAEALVRAGVTRITSLARQPWPSPWWTHDGQGPLRTLVRWSTLEADHRPEA